MKLSIILPAKNEASGLSEILPELVASYPDAEILVVDDGSNDNTAEVLGKFPVRHIRHPYSIGNGAAIKSGARAATGDALVFMDADGQHSPGDISKLLEVYQQGYHMVVGARKISSHASLIRLVGNKFYNWLASFMTGFRIEDLTSGFRIADARIFRKFLYLLPNGFSYPTTSTMAFFRSGHLVKYVPITASTRIGKSNIKLLTDGMRFILIILKIGALFSPMRLFFPISLITFLIGASYYLYTFLSYGRFTNMSAVLILSSLFVFLIGILSEQVSALHYRESEKIQPDSYIEH